MEGLDAQATHSETDEQSAEKEALMLPKRRTPRAIYCWPVTPIWGTPMRDTVRCPCAIGRREQSMIDFVWWRQGEDGVWRRA